MLINGGAEINKARTDNGITPLLIAAQKGNLQIVEILLKNGALINQARSDNGATPLYIAA